MSKPLEFSGYTFGEHDEFCLKSGSSHDNQILIVPPLFDEMNRVRHMLIEVMHLLDENGTGSILPDLPGCNESPFPQDQASLSQWRQALAICSEQHGHPGFILSMRGGCLIDDYGTSARRWRLAPAKGRSLLRTMMRARIASDKESGIATSSAGLAEIAASASINLAGNHIGPRMFSELHDAVPSENGGIRRAELETGAATADVRLAGSALWLRAEPDSDSVLSAAITKDILQWIVS